jgi:hypothetical protein
VQGNETLQQLIDAIGDDPLLCCPLLSGGISPFQLRRENPLRSHTSLKGDPPEDPDRVLAQTRSGPTSPIQNDEYLATFGVTFTPKPGQPVSQ